MENKNDFLSKMTQKAQEAMQSETAQKAKEKAKELAEGAAQKAQEAMQSETAQKAKEKAKELAEGAAQKAQEAMQSETAQKAKAMAGAAVQEAQQAVSEAVAETAGQAQQVYAAAQAGEGLAAVKKAKFSKKTVVTFGVVAVLIIVLLGIAGITSGGGLTVKDLGKKLEKNTPNGFFCWNYTQKEGDFDRGMCSLAFINSQTNPGAGSTDPSLDMLFDSCVMVNFSRANGNLATKPGDKVASIGCTIHSNSLMGDLAAVSAACIKALQPSIDDAGCLDMVSFALAAQGAPYTDNGLAVTYEVYDGSVTLTIEMK